MLNPGDVRTYQRGNGNAVVLGVGLWAQKQNGWIQIHMTGNGDGHTWVTNNPGSERYHRTLFRNLRRTLVQENCWPFGEEGSETEAKRLREEFEPVAIRGRSLSDTLIEERGDR